MEIRRTGIVKDSEIFASLESAVIENGTLRLRVKCPSGDYTWTDLLIGYTFKIEDDREDYLISPQSITEAGSGVEMVCNIDLEEFPFKPTNWNIRAVYEKDGEKYSARVQHKFRRIRTIDLLRGGYSYITGNGYIVFTCTTRGGYLGLRYREKTPYDGKLTKIKEAIAFSRYMRDKDKYDAMGIYLIYEKKCEKAQDNAYYLFKYCMDSGAEKYLNRSIFYVIKKDSPDMKKLDPYRPNVIIFGSIRHMIYLLASRLLISSDAKAHGYIWQYDRSLIGQRMADKRYVFLGHGVLALKKLNDTFLAKRQNAVMTTVTSDAEAEIVTKYLGYNESDAVVTGYARFDGLQDDSDKHREILIMPTHRSWLFGVDRDTFVNSEYYGRYMDLLNSRELAALLEKHDLTANFYLHPSINEHFDAFSTNCDRVHLIPMGSVPLDELMMHCSLLVTDYSSVCWDLYYMGKPAVFYQYDTNKYMDTWGSYIDLEKDTPGYRPDTLEDLIVCIRSSAENGFKLDATWAARREEHFRYIDRDNCKRIVEELKERNYL